MPETNTVSSALTNDLDERFPDVGALSGALERTGYLAGDQLSAALFLAVRMGQPILLEGEPGVGKTEAAKALAATIDTPLVRLQCYEGIAAAEALYEWNYPRQLLAIRLAEAVGDREELRELHAPVAGGARAGRLAVEVRAREGIDDGACEERAPVEGVVRKPEGVCHAARVVLVLRRAATAVTAGGALVFRVVPEVQRHADHLVPGVHEARRGDRGVDPATHGDDDSLCTRHIPPPTYNTAQNVFQVYNV